MTGYEMSPWSQGMVVTKVPSVPVISSVSVSPQSQDSRGRVARVHFNTDNSELCQLKLVDENEMISEAGDSCPTCCTQERLSSFPLPASLPCGEHSVTVRCGNKLTLDKVTELRPLNPQ